MSPSTLRRVTVIGSGLIGTSAALALRRAGVQVRLRDVDPDASGPGGPRRPRSRKRGEDGGHDHGAFRQSPGTGARRAGRPGIS